MQAIELETWIDKNGHIRLPQEYQHAYGKAVRLLVLLPEETETKKPLRQPGSAKGLIKILIEDEEHLKDFAEYMP